MVKRQKMVVQTDGARIIRQEGFQKAEAKVQKPGAMVRRQEQNQSGK